MYYVYSLIDPRTNQPFYVGKGTGNRAHQHFIEAKRAPVHWTNARKCQHIRQLWDLGSNPVVLIVQDHLTESEALDVEIAQIAMHGRICNGTGILTNVQAHNAPSAKASTPVVAYTITGAIKGSFESVTAAANFYNVHKSTICSALNKRTHSSAGLRWFHADEPFMYSPSPIGTSVDQFGFDGSLRATFPTIASASEAASVTYTQIVDCCSGRAGAAGGYQWAYAGDRPIRPVTDRMRRVNSPRVLLAIDPMTEQRVAEFNTIKEAVAATAANASGISDCAAGRKKSSGGLKWTWENKEGPN